MRVTRVVNVTFVSIEIAGVVRGFKVVTKAVKDKYYKQKRIDKGRALVTNGVWSVPPEERPEGWQRMGIKEC